MLNALSIKDRLQDAMKAAMRSQDKQRLTVVRLMLSALKQVEVDERIAIDDTRAIMILDKMLKQRRESIQQYDQAGRKDLADQERYEIELIQSFLPQPLTEAEITQFVDQAIEQTGAKSLPDMGKVMASLKPQMLGRADMAVVSAKIKERLQ